MNAGSGDPDWLCWLLIDRVELFNELEHTEAFNNSAENDCLSVHEGQGCAESHVELALVGVGYASSFAHAQESGLRVLHMERLICELSVIYGVPEF